MLVEMSELIPEAGDTLVLTLSRTQAGLHLTAMAKTKLAVNNKFTVTPLVLSGPVGELEARLLQELQEFTVPHQGMMSNLRTALQDIEEKSKPKPVTKPATKPTPREEPTQPAVPTGPQVSLF